MGHNFGSPVNTKNTTNYKYKCKCNGRCSSNFASTTLRRTSHVCPVEKTATTSCLRARPGDHRRHDYHHLLLCHQRHLEMGTNWTAGVSPISTFTFLVTFILSGDKLNNKRFSPCSLSAINRVLQVKARGAKGCFNEPQQVSGVVVTIIMMIWPMYGDIHSC